MRGGLVKSTSSLMLDGLRRMVPGPPKPHLLIACMPKSASTFIATVISELGGMRRCRLVPAWGAREQELSRIRLSRYNHSSYVAQHHVKYSDWTGDLIKAFNLTPVVTVRNLADCVVSGIEHYNRESVVSPLASYDKAILNHDVIPFDRAVVQLAIPWYLNFYIGWLQAGVPIYDYDDLIADPAAGVSSIVAHAGMTHSRDEIEAAIDRCTDKQTRFNVGKTGRGRNLSKPTAEALLDLLALYPSYQETPLFLKTTETARQAIANNG